MQCPEINWDAQDISTHDPRTQESELQVQKIINLQNITNNLPDVFTNYKGVTKSYHPARNVPERIEVPNKTIQIPPSKPALGKRGEVRPSIRMWLLNAKGNRITKILNQ